MKIKLLSIIIIALASIHSANAQNDLQVKVVFDTYGKQNGSVLVLLSKDVLLQGSNLTLYKSIVMDESPEKLKMTNDAIETDIKKGSKISEITNNGKIESGVYLLFNQKRSSDNEYLLYKNKSKKITVVYVKGVFPPQKLDQELNKLKDLFILVNNKRIKLNQ